MNNPLRIRRILKWAGVVVCCVFLLLWAVSLKWHAEYDWRSGGFRLRPGGIQYTKACQPNLEQWCGWRIGQRSARVRYVYQRNWGAYFPSQWDYQEPGQSKGINYRVSLRHWYVPLWIHFAVAAIPTAFLFYRDRRRVPVSHCKRCGYDLTGNVSRICPECGTKIIN